MTAWPRLGAVCATLLLAAVPAPAAETTKVLPPTAPAKSAVVTEGATIALPKFEVSASRVRAIDATIKHLEKLVTREKKLLEKSVADETLNNEKVSRSAALFGGKSAVQRASVAAVRVESMEKEIALLDTLRTPLTTIDRALIEQLVQDQRTYRRELDLTLR